MRLHSVQQSIPAQLVSWTLHRAGVQGSNPIYASIKFLQRSEY
jgi:hypothetical protein